MRSCVRNPAPENGAHPITIAAPALEMLATHGGDRLTKSKCILHVHMETTATLLATLVGRTHTHPRQPVVKLLDWHQNAHAKR